MPKTVIKRISRPKLSRIYYLKLKYIKIKSMQRPTKSPNLKIRTIRKIQKTPIIKRRMKKTYNLSKRDSETN